MIENDPEITAMARVIEALAGLEEEGRRRVLTYVATRYSLGPVQKMPVGPPGTEQSDREQREFSNLADLFDRAGPPKTDAMKALVAGYWFQEIDGAAELEALTLNKALKDLGHGVGNITDSLSSLMQRKPALALQIKKQGTSKQARKKYRITKAGISAVHQMLMSGTPEA